MKKKLAVPLVDHYGSKSEAPVQMAGQRVVQRVLNDTVCARPGFSPAYDFGSSPSSASKLDQRHMHRTTAKERPLADGGGGGRGAISYDGEKTWCSINHSILSNCRVVYLPLAHILYNLQLG